MDGMSQGQVIYTNAHQKFPTEVSSDGAFVLFQEQTLDPVRKT